MRRGVPSLIFLRGGAAETCLSDVEVETPSPLCTQATPATRLREVLAKAYVDVGAYRDGAVEALWAELSRRESCLGVEKGKLVRVAHAVRIRVVAGDRCVLRVRGLEADEIDTRTFLGATVPVLQKSSGRVCTQQSPAGAAAALARQAVLEPLGLTKARVVPRGACETSVAPRVPHQLPGVATRVTYHFFDVVLDTFEDRAAERKALDDERRIAEAAKAD